jgi:membrane protein YdbS with pleckstrin-like domain
MSAQLPDIGKIFFIGGVILWFVLIAIMTGIGFWWVYLHESMESTLAGMFICAVFGMLFYISIVIVGNW